MAIAISEEPSYNVHGLPAGRKTVSLVGFLSPDCSEKKNKMKVIVAVARKMLVSVWHVLHDNVEYIDFKHDCEESANNG